VGHYAGIVAHHGVDHCDAPGDRCIHRHGTERGSPYQRTELARLDYGTDLWKFHRMMRIPSTAVSVIPTRRG
jgi:hypothetical protein